MNEFIITFRECLEASLIVGIIYTVLDKNDLSQEKRVLWYGVLSSLVASIIVGVILASINSAVGNTSYEKLFEAVFMYMTAGILFYVIFWLARHVSNRKEIEKSVKVAVAGSSLALFLLVFFAILREGFETALFIIASFTNTGVFSYFGFASGMILAILIGYLVVIQGRKVDLRSFFKATTLLLVFFASGMVAYGTHEAEEYFVKSGKLEKQTINRVWDIHQPSQALNSNDKEIFYTYNTASEKYYHVLHDKGSVGVFLKGFFGYNSNPNWIEFILWLGSILFGLKMWSSFYRIQK
ncbi:FTR1 family protein [Hyphomicrobiales bacterium]|jgi:high-affinity iron transporter|nr:FTR1 family protein [Hyphomicrobiales bacterium]|tara:strand:+ start:10649 stop:11536 length:888 start_codon:yes stop_codon:yes gene_type:complete